MYVSFKWNVKKNFTNISLKFLKKIIEIQVKTVVVKKLILKEEIEVSDLKNQKLI